MALCTGRGQRLEAVLASGRQRQNRDHGSVTADRRSARPPRRCSAPRRRGPRPVLAILARGRGERLVQPACVANRLAYRGHRDAGNVGRGGRFHSLLVVACAVQAHGACSRRRARRGCDWRVLPLAHVTAAGDPRRGAACAYARRAVAVVSLGVGAGDTCRRRVRGRSQRDAGAVGVPQTAAIRTTATAAAEASPPATRSDARTR